MSMQPRPSLPELAELVAVVDTGPHDGRNAKLAAGPLIARLKAANRAANEATRIAKQRTQDARQAMDNTHLGLQNLLYEKRHLESEIDKCRQFESIYEDVPVHDLNEFKLRAPEEATAPDVLQDEHQLMLNRLSFELAERQRLDERKKALTTRRDSLLKDVKDQQSELDSVAQQFDAVAKLAVELQKKMLALTLKTGDTPGPSSQ